MEDNLKRLVSETTRLLRESGKTIVMTPPFARTVAMRPLTVKRITGDPLNVQSYEPAMIASVAKFLHSLVMKQDTSYVCTASMQLSPCTALNTAPVFYALAVTGPRPLKDTSMESYEKFYLALAVLGSKAEGEAGNDIQGETVNVSQALVLFEQMNADLVSGLDASGELEGELQHNLLR
eukprot:gene8406-18297_t